MMTKLIIFSVKSVLCEALVTYIQYMSTLNLFDKPLSVHHCHVCNWWLMISISYLLWRDVRIYIYIRFHMLSTNGKISDLHCIMLVMLMYHWFISVMSLLIVWK